jgi:DNA repair protein RadC
LKDRSTLFEYVRSLGDEDREWLIALFVDDKVRLISIETIAVGDRHSAPLPINHLVQRGLAQSASGFFLVHNHPSGDPTPSPADVMVTRKIARITHELDMPLLEHMIVAGGEMAVVSM